MHVHRWRRILETEVLTQYLGLACFKHPKLFFQFFPLGALGRHHLLHDLGAAGCIRDRETTAGAAAATTAATGEQSCARTNTATSRWETVNCQDCKFKWVNVSYEQPERSTLSLSDPVGAQHWNVRWDAGYDASCTWQDVRHGEGLTWTWDLLLSDVAGRRSQGETETVEKSCRIKEKQKLDVNSMKGPLQHIGLEEAVMRFLTCLSLLQHHAETYFQEHCFYFHLHF